MFQNHESGVRVESLRQDGFTSTGNIVQISQRFISERIIMGEQDLHSCNQFNEALVDIWRKEGHSYTPDQATRIRQVIVQFPQSGRTKYYAYPGIINVFILFQNRFLTKKNIFLINK